MRALGLSWEVLTVDDSSRDRTAEMVRERMRSEPGIVLVSFARNFGQRGGHRRLHPRAANGW